MSKKPIVIYGASGYTGRLVAEACARAGVHYLGSTGEATYMDDMSREYQ